MEATALINGEYKKVQIEEMTEESEAEWQEQSLPQL